MERATRKIGQNKGKRRLWIEGTLLVAAGLDHGNRWDLIEAPHGFLIVRNPEGKRKVAGKPGRPIIDITGKTLDVIPNALTVSLSYRLGGGEIGVCPDEVAS